MKNTAPYGSWPSAITTDLMTAGTIGLSETRIFNGEIYWVESRPTEQGRSVIVKLDQAGQKQELLPAEYSSRSRVHEYGGACYLPTVHGVFFVNHADQQIYLVDQNLSVSNVTDLPAYRFADLQFNDVNNTLIAIAEEHASGVSEPANSLVSVDIKNGDLTVLHQGQDFYSSASFSGDGKKICWLSWMHPNMPWDGTCLWQASFDSNTLSDVHIVAGSESESVFQPQWSPGGELFFVSDQSNWWNLYKTNADSIESVCAMDAEFGLPLWQFGMTRYTFLNNETILTSYSQSGVEKLATIDLLSGVLSDLEQQYGHYGSLRADSGKYCFIAQSSTTFPSVYFGQCDNDKFAAKQIITSFDTVLNQDHFSVAEPVSYKTGDGQTAHAFFYSPAHAEVQAPATELPPLIVMIHGGPTSATDDSLSFKIQYWTNRGFAVLDVNYRGSTGYGRQYRDALKLQWGVADVEDCDFGVRHLVQLGLVDKDRVAIRGGSAGGFTVLAALAHTQTFKAGTSLYGVTDLTALATDTHKFESRYLDSLIGPYPEQKDLYHQRSPLNHAASIQCPVLFLQGLDDKVVPPSQAEAMIEKLKANDVPVAYLAFEGEAHGFRKSETITRAMEAELWFYGSVFDFKPHDNIDPVAFI